MSEAMALVTGASAGLGAEFARQLARRGHGLLLVARRKERLEALAHELAAAHGVRVEVVAADLGDPEAPAQLEAIAAERGLQIDWLVNNAGVAGPDLLLDRDWSAQVRFFELMMLSVAQLCHRFVPPMRERGDIPLVIAYAIQGLFGLAIWASILWIPRAIIGSIIAYGVSVAGTSALEGFVFHQQVPQAAVIQIGVVLVFTAVAAYATHKTHLFGN